MIQWWKLNQAKISWLGKAFQPLHSTEWTARNGVSRNVFAIDINLYSSCCGFYTTFFSQITWSRDLADGSHSVTYFFTHETCQQHFGILWRNKPLLVNFVLSSFRKVWIHSYKEEHSSRMRTDHALIRTSSERASTGTIVDRKTPVKTLPPPCGR